MILKLQDKKFEIGKLVVTPKLADEINMAPVVAAAAGKFLQRHVAGDWGDLVPEDIELNNKHLETGLGRLMSSYKFNPATRIWIITEADRSVTTMLFPEEY